jgi:sensor histidine kinase YesM
MILTGQSRNLDRVVHKVHQYVNIEISARGFKNVLSPHEYWKSSDQHRQKANRKSFRMKSFNIFKSWLPDNTNSWIRFLAVVLIFSLSIHRILGYLFAIAVRNVLGRNLKGSFLVDFKWIGVRLGFDRNEVVFHDIMFHNPPQFTDTPYFMSVGHVVVR